MIASLGGAEVNKYGARNYPGSGGMVGGLSFEGGNWAYWGGAGAKYNRFTPSGDGGTQGTICLDCEPNLPAPEPMPNYPQVPPWEPTPPNSPTQIPTNIPTTPAPTTTTGTPMFPICQTRDCGGVPNEPTLPTEPTETPTVPSTIMSAINALLAGIAPRTSVTSTPPLFSFNPPSVGGAGVDMRQIIVLGVIGFGAWFLYKKYA